MSTITSIEDLLEYCRQRDEHETEFLQSVEEVLKSLKPVFDDDPSHFEVMKHLLEPERVVQFRVAWEDDEGHRHVNRGWRVQFNSALGPYKGGLRFHPSVTLSVLKFLAFEQVFKNALTGQMLGGGKGGVDVDMHGRSDAESMRICQAFMTELHRHIGADRDVPAGDIGVRQREIGFLFGQYKRLNSFEAGVLTGKGPGWGGSFGRTEATGYGLVMMARMILHDERDESLKGKRVLVSGSGNVAVHAIEHLLEAEQAIVLTASDSGGTVVIPNGFTSESLAALKLHKLQQRGRLSDFPTVVPEAQYHEGQTPWDVVDAEIAMPCATQNEIHQGDAKALLKRGVTAVLEGANMPCTNDALEVFKANAVLYVPGKSSNAGGVATSGLEMVQDAQRMQWSKEETLRQLETVMGSIWDQIKAARSRYNVSIQEAANIAGYLRVANAMKAQGWY